MDLSVICAPQTQVSSVKCLGLGISLKIPKLVLTLLLGAMH